VAKNFISLKPLEPSSFKAIYMAHFARIQNGVVVSVIVAEQSIIDSGVFGSPSEWVQTSYNTHGGKHYSPNSDTKVEDSGTPLRANFAGVGHVYDAINDVFHAPRPLDKNGLICESWTIGAPDWIWKPPVPCPPAIVVDVKNPKNASANFWDEPTKSWVVLTNSSK
jgi:hypothetical protein